MTNSPEATHPPEPGEDDVFDALVERTRAVLDSAEGIADRRAAGLSDPTEAEVRATVWRAYVRYGNPRRTP